MVLIKHELTIIKKKKNYKMKKYWLKKVALFSLCFVAFVLVVGWVVMALWNAVLPAVAGFKEINFVQAIGILLLSKILFGGFHGKFGNRGNEDLKMKLKEKFGNMSPEEKENFKAEWKSRCRNRWHTKEAGVTEHQP